MTAYVYDRNKKFYFKPRVQRITEFEYQKCIEWDTTVDGVRFECWDEWHSTGSGYEAYKPQE